MGDKIAIMGPGAVGSYVGAFLAREGGQGIGRPDLSGFRTLL